VDREEVGEASVPAIAGTAEVPAEVRDYPAQLGIDYQEEYSRLLPLVKWLLAIPHFFVLTFLGIGAAFVLFIAFFAVLFTGSWPRGMFDFVVGVQRWAVRVYAYVGLMTDEYPPFSLGEEPGYPARAEIAYPVDGVDNWRPLVHWLLIFPYALVSSLLLFASGFLVFIAFFAILFTKRYPRGMFEFAEVTYRWQLRTNAYAYFMVTRYPPFTLG
jgi:hypothetical protein